MSKSKDIPLTPAESVVNDPDAVEIIRIWWSRNEPAFALKPAFRNPESFGVMLAQAVRHMAYAYGQREIAPQDEAYDAILKGFNRTIDGPTVETVLEKDAGTAS
ncbi:DUF5076 domain-containing protein [Brevundimonas sp. S30B]|uniref:DUF5076 domain-containing protein n=1 Tax=unclassified Brevundimonas TaxID=2622653 RepID=UPI001072E9BA|nr:MULTISPECIES: DUF5076 domain-containing protein [unclassified Brevundimonas]QBX37911.1 DUF5076 domain-containing protein [Brevundimonas sp. MF30-B]TFW02734.1 DUF5076 domain-containing protein [Brevundimonas sp. S30B]